MILYVLERHRDTYIFKESDPRAYDHFSMRPIVQIEKLIENTPAQLIALKAVLEAHDLYWMLDYFNKTKLIWMYRDYSDVINSSSKRFDNSRNYIDEIVEDPRRGFWRGQGMTNETLSILRAHYTKDISDNSTQALFWYYRNQLFFDQNFADDDRVLLIKYEAFVEDPRKYILQILKFIELEPRQDVIKMVHSRSIKKNSPPKIDDDIAKICTNMLERLDSVFQERVEKQLSNS